MQLGHGSWLLLLFGVTRVAWPCTGSGDVPTSSAGAPGCPPGADPVSCLCPAAALLAGALTGAGIQQLGNRGTCRNKVKTSRWTDSVFRRNQSRGNALSILTYVCAKA